MSGRVERRYVLRTESGSVVEAAIVVPAAMLVVFLAVQGALWAHAESVMQASAAAAVQAACVAGGSPASGDTSARDLLARLGGQLVSRPTVQVENAAGGTVDVHVAGTVASIIPWIHLPVAADRTGTRQEFRSSG